MTVASEVQYMQSSIKMNNIMLGILNILLYLMDIWYADQRIQQNSKSSRVIYTLLMINFAWWARYLFRVSIGIWGYHIFDLQATN